jgi:hypothetical protein
MDETDEGSDIRRVCSSIMREETSFGVMFVRSAVERREVKSVEYEEGRA